MYRLRSLPGLLLGAMAALTLSGAAAVHEARTLAVTASTTLGVTANQTVAQDLGTATFPASLRTTVNYTSGTGTGQVDVLWSDTRTLTASASENIDLAGVLTDAFGSTVTFAKVKAVIVTAASGNTNNVVVGGAASNAFVGAFGDATDTEAVKPGGWYGWGFSGSGFTVTAGTGDILKIANSGAGTSVTYSIIVLGTSA